MITAIAALLAILTALVLISVVQLGIIVCQLSDLNGHALTNIGIQQQINDREVWTW